VAVVHEFPSGVNSTGGQNGCMSDDRAQGHPAPGNRAGNRAQAKRRRREARLAGLLGAAAGLLGMWLFSALAPEAQFPPTAVGDWLVRTAPGDLATFFIESLQHWALRLLTGGLIVISLAIGAELAARMTSARAALLLGIAAALTSFLAPGPTDYVPSFANAALGALLYWRVTEAILRPLREPDLPDISRRRTLKVAAGGVGALAIAGGLAAWIGKRLSGPNTDVALVEPMDPAAIPTRDEWPDIPGLTPEITSVEDHYVVDINLFPPSVEAEGWSLKVHGAVDAPLDLNFRGLQQDFEVVEEHAVLVCVSNEIGGDLIGHSAWGGVRLAEVLEAAGTRPGARDVIFRAADGYSDSIPIDVARAPSTLLAVSQNGAPLTQEHGFPCRVRVPSIYGMKNVKWLREIEVVENDYNGYWQSRGWSDEAVVKTASRIDVAGNDGTARVGEETWIAGIAWAGDRGISKVEVSTDGGKKWTEAMVREPISDMSWSQWAYRWTPQTKGRQAVQCRATDGTGKVQTAREAPPHPDGASGYDETPVEVI
jgi:DMSO/TMAO reductase YedYZ molybdopterin-dependent catalytic subunit